MAEKDRADEVLRVFAKWGLDAVVVGKVIAEPRLRILHHGELVADIPNRRSLTMRRSITVPWAIGRRRCRLTRRRRFWRS